MAKKINSKVNKALSPEEQTIIGNIQSLLQELGSDAGGEEEVMMEDELLEDEEVMKANEGPTANPQEKAEDRVEQGTEITEDNYSEVGKALLSMLSKQKVAKSAPARRPVVKKNDAVVMKTLADISVAMKSIADQQNQNNLAINNILEGLGVTENLSSIEVNKSAKPVQNLDASAVLKSIVDSIQNNNQQTSVHMDNFNVKKSARDDLRNALPNLLGHK